MKIIFTSLTSPYVKTGFANLKPSGFMFVEEGRWAMKAVSAMGAGGTTGAGNGTISDAVGSIVGAIKENSDDKDRLLLELVIAIDYFKSSKEISEFFSSKEISEFFEKVLEGLAPKESETDDWD